MGDGPTNAPDMTMTDPASPFGNIPVPDIGTNPPMSENIPGVPQANPANKAQDILKQLATIAARKRLAPGGPPAAIPGREDPNAARQIGMNTNWPAAWGLQRFSAGLQTGIRNAVAKQKEDQLLRAEGDWTYLQSSMNELFDAQQSGDQAAIAAAQKKVDATLSDPKKLKNMAKALNQDWLNPEKTTVYGEALKKTMAKQKEQDAQNSKKQQAAQGLKSVFQKLIGQRQQAQLTDEDRQRMAREIQEKAPIQTGIQDPKLLIEAEKAHAEEVKAEAELVRAQKTNPEKYHFQVIKDKDGSDKVVALDQTDPTKPYIEVKSASGEKTTPGGKHVAGEGKLEIVKGIPTGRVMHDGKFVAPGQPGYSKEDAAAVGMGMKAVGLSDAQNDKLAQLRGSSYARAKAANTPIAVTDNETGESTYATMLQVAQNPSKYVQPGESEKISARDAVHRSLKANFGALDKDLDGLPNGLDTETQAVISLALKGDNPGVLETLLVNKVKQNAPDEVLRYITDIKVMQEDILVLRNVGGMGTGSDMMRAAMIRTIPGTGSSSVKEAKMQMEGAQRTSESLFAGRVKAKFSDKGDEGGMETKTYNGAVYQRKKGSKDSWSLVPAPTTK